MPLTLTPVTLGEHEPDTAKELVVTPVTLALNTTLTLMGLVPVEAALDTVPLMDDTVKGGTSVQV